MLRTLVREPSRSLGACQLTYVARERIDLARATEQHHMYIDTLRRIGVTVTVLPPLHEHPDAVFVEDTAIVLDEIAIMTRPGAPSRQGEVTSVAEALERYRPLEWIREPATLDGGDVLPIGHDIYVGLSRRTSADALGQLQQLVGPHGYLAIPIPVGECLHLESAVSVVAPDRLLVNREWIDVSLFGSLETLSVPAQEPRGANTLRVGDVVYVAASCPRTRDLLERNGISTVTLDISELQKAEAGLSCLSLVFEDGAPRPSY